MLTKSFARSCQRHIKSIGSVNHLIKNRNLSSRSNKNTIPDFFATSRHWSSKTNGWVIGDDSQQPSLDLEVELNNNDNNNNGQNNYKLETPSMKRSSQILGLFPGAHAVSSSQPRVRVRDILLSKKSKAFTIFQNKTVKDCIAQLVTEETHSLLVLDERNKEVIGLFTAKDVLRHIHSFSKDRNVNSKFTDDELLKTTVADIMTPREKIVYCSPDDTSRRCREIMFHLKIRNMPVMEGGEVIGMITMRALADAAFSMNKDSSSSGKKAFMQNIMGRKGVPLGTKVRKGAAKPVFGTDSKSSVWQRTKEERANDEKEAVELMEAAQRMLDLEVGTYALPHPFKSQAGVAGNKRAMGGKALATDIDLSEDDFFAVRASSIAAPEDNSSAGAAMVVGASDSMLSGEVYLCVADGVGSWREYGVDPREYSHRLVANAKKVIENDVMHRELVGDSLFDRDLTPIQPLDVMLDAWNYTANEEVVGSCTICVATLDRKLGQLSYANVGDCGLVVFRRATAENMGTLGTLGTMGAGSNSDFSNKIVYMSQQQLKGFNMPYQLGNSVDPSHPSVFESPVDADVSSINVIYGDIILMATDGLFDNMSLDEITELVSKYDDEQHTLMQGYCGVDGAGGICDKALAAGVYSAESLNSLAKTLGNTARELSLDTQRDSPFALLAKENDIMWGGGMPDDTTIVIARVVNTREVSS